ncbi:MAG: hypothetical protein IJU05_08700 [Schwartzia sp.]|nr:hypothetical protein [Schwartzia sp. (in: firmicutes)]
MKEIREWLAEGGALLRGRVAATLRDESVTMSGELIVTRPGMTRVTEEEVRGSGALVALAPLSAMFPTLDMRLEGGILSTDIRFFLYEAPVTEPGLYETLCRLSEDALAALASKGLEARLSVRGERRHFNRVESFHCLNKGGSVSCKITEDRERRFFFRELREGASEKLAGI